MTLEPTAFRHLSRQVRKRPGAAKEIDARKRAIIAAVRGREPPTNGQDANQLANTLRPRAGADQPAQEPALGGVGSKVGRGRREGRLRIRCQSGPFHHRAEQPR